MNKKVEKKAKSVKKYDDKEDLEIKKVASYKESSQILLLFILIVLFGFTLFNTLYYISKYHDNDNNYNSGVETIEINNSKNNVFILNSGSIDRTIKSLQEGDDEEIVIVSESSIALNNKDKEDGTILFDVKYNISKNDFPSNVYSKDDSDVRVRFAYSFDKENWTYVGNVISTYESTINPLIGNYFDVSGLVTTLKVATNYELTSKPHEENIMYWKSETIIKNNENNIDKQLKANFKIEYKESL